MDSNHFKIVIIILLVLGLVKCTQKLSHEHRQPDGAQKFLLRQ